MKIFFAAIALCAISASAALAQEAPIETHFAQVSRLSTASCKGLSSYITGKPYAYFNQATPIQVEYSILADIQLFPNTSAPGARRKVAILKFIGIGEYLFGQPALTPEEQDYPIFESWVRSCD